MKSQNSVNCAGGNAIGVDGSASFTVGQIDYTSAKGSSGSFSLGVQQTYEIQFVDAIEEVNSSIMSCKVFPNPVTETLNLKIETEKAQIFQANLYDMNGKLLENVDVNNNQSDISMRNFPPAIYFLKVIENNQVVKTFKVVKR